MKITALATLVMFLSATAWADNYKIDTEGAHAFVQFRVKHLGYSWLYGRFNDFTGEFSYDEKDPSKNKVSVTLKMDSLDSMHAERDKHLRSSDFLNVAKYKTASFESTKYTPKEGNIALLTGKLSLFGKTREVSFEIEHIGGGKDPWGGYRQGFEGKLSINPEDWGAKMSFPVNPVELTLSVEGIRQ